MKKFINKVLVFGGLLITPMLLNAQVTQSENYVQSTVYKVPVQESQIQTVEEKDKNRTVQYFDGLGRLKQSVVVGAGGVVFTDNNLPIDWTSGDTGSTDFYNAFGSTTENQIVSGTTPFGDTDLLWECVNDVSAGPDGGWDTDSFDIDNTKSYRYTVWVKKNMVGSGTGRTYHGIKNVDLVLNGGGNPNNPYFWYGFLPQADTWYLMVGVVHPHDYTGENTGVSGLYDVNGNKIFGGNEFKWRSGLTTTFLRNYLYSGYNTNLRQYLWSPLFQEMDGTELSLNDVFTQEQVVTTITNTKDIVTHVEYDAFGRQAKEYLPYAANTTNGAYRTSNIDVETQSYYKNKYSEDFAGVSLPDVNAYSEKSFDNSPLNRVIKQAAPGEDWKRNDIADGHEIEFNYDTNIQDEVKLFEVSITESSNQFTPTLTGGTTSYNVGELYKTVTKDENHDGTSTKLHTTEEFKNKQGQVILKRTYAKVNNVETAHDTYYVYDDYGNLTYVLPPKINTSTSTLADINGELDDLGYQYKYDYRNRLVEKKIPGKGWETIVYDMLDRPVMTQDTIQKTNKEWLYTKYDKLGRVISSGIYTHATEISQQQMQAHFNTENQQTTSNAASKMFESRETSSTNHYYTNDNFPKVNTEVLTVNYYDNYDYDLVLPTGLTANTPITTSYGVTSTSRTKGLATGSRVKVLGETDWITTLTYYDEKARPIYVHSQNNYLVTIDIVESKLDDFTGKVYETRTSHTKDTNDAIVTIDRFEYDHQDRLVSQSQKIGDQLTKQLVKNNYDDLGQLESKLVGEGIDKGYIDVVGVSIIEGEITKTIAGNWGSAGLATKGSFQGNGYVEFTAITTDKYLMVGLSDENGSAHHDTMDYCIYLYGNSKVRVKAPNTGFMPKSTYQPGDTFRIERNETTIYYYQNEALIYTSNVESTGPLLGDVSMLHIGGKFKDFNIVDKSKGLQKVDYAYNVRGWLKNINQDTSDDNDLFNFGIKYNDPTDMSKALFNGNISQTSWNSLSVSNDLNPKSNLYTYNYDALNRITSAIDNTTNYNLSSITYDRNGNILTLKRKGLVDDNITFDDMDDLTYTYDLGNKLQEVKDRGDTTYGFKEGTNSGDDYVYDANGNMIKDLNKEITSIVYNHLNLPTTVNIGTGTITYIYDASGVKQKKIVSTGTNTEYAGNYIYKDNALQFFNHPEGYVQPNNTGGYDYIYQYKDHLGNVRLSYTDNNNDGVIDPATEIVEESNYYPFGLKHKGYNNVVSSLGNSTAQKFGFGGKEHQDELGLGWIDITARNYDASLGRWMNLDPLAEQMRRHSPYNYAFDNPVYFVDPDGMAPVGNPIVKAILRYMVKTMSKQKSRLVKSRGSYKKLISEHKQKLSDFMKDPIGNSSKEAIAKMSKDNPTKEVLLERAKGRAGALKKQIKKQEGELSKIEKSIEKISSDISKTSEKLSSVAVVTTGTIETGNKDSDESSSKETKTESMGDKVINFLKSRLDKEANSGKTIFGKDSKVGKFIDNWLNPMSIWTDLKDLPEEKK